MSDPLPLEWDCASCVALRAEIERLKAAAAMALVDLEQTYCHVSSVSADRIKSATIPALRAALAGKKE